VIDPIDPIDPTTPPDLAAIERDLSAVESALSALDDGSYWVDGATGEPIPDAVLAADPVARRV
jgi:RNA polymerase-binding transcription factor DksA